MSLIGSKYVSKIISYDVKGVQSTETSFHIYVDLILELSSGSFYRNDFQAYQL